MNRLVVAMAAVIVVLVVSLAVLVVVQPTKTRVVAPPTPEQVPVRVLGGSPALTNNKRLIHNVASAPHMVAVALEYWTAYNHGVNPCPGGVTVTIKRMPDGAIGQAPVGKGLCRFAYSPRLRQFNGDIICASFIHELGHSALGLQHSDDPRDIMYWLVSRVPALCHRPDVHRGNHRYQVVVPGLVRIAQTLRRRYGLVITSSVGGVHAPHSYHYLGEAIDLGGSSYNMGRAVLYLKRHGLARRFLEGIHNSYRRAYTLSVYHGRPIGPYFWGPVTWSQHRNHIHIAQSV